MQRLDLDPSIKIKRSLGSTIPFFEDEKTIEEKLKKIQGKDKWTPDEITRRLEWIRTCKQPINSDSDYAFTIPSHRPYKKVSPQRLVEEICWSIFRFEKRISSLFIHNFPLSTKSIYDLTSALKRSSFLLNLSFSNNSFTHPHQGRAYDLASFFETNRTVIALDLGNNTFDGMDEDEFVKKLEKNFTLTYFSPVKLSGYSAVSEKLHEIIKRNKAEQEKFILAVEKNDKAIIQELLQKGVSPVLSAGQSSYETDSQPVKLSSNLYPARENFIYFENILHRILAAERWRSKIGLENILTVITTLFEVLTPQQWNQLLAQKGQHYLTPLEFAKSIEEKTGCDFQPLIQFLENNSNIKISEMTEMIEKQPIKNPVIAKNSKQTPEDKKITDETKENELKKMSEIDLIGSLKQETIQSTIGEMNTTFELDRRTIIRTTYKSPQTGTQIYKVLGKGAFGTVYAGIWNECPIAIKELNSLPKDGVELESIKREIYLLSNLRSPYIVTFYGACTQDYIPMERPMLIIMEYMPLGSLKKIITQYKEDGDPYSGYFYPLSWSDLGRMASEIAHGLSYLHANKIVHCDMKHENILVSVDLHVKISDFGISKKDDQTTLGMGTHLYTAVEKYDGAHFTFASDVYSFGIMLAEMGHRKVPCFTANVMEIVRGKRPSIPNDCPLEVTELMKSCWQKEPDKRPTASDLVSALSNHSLFASPGTENETKEIRKSPETSRLQRFL